MLKEKPEILMDQNELKPKLSATIKLVLHTKAAQSVFNKAWRNGRMGLLQFAKIINFIWHAAIEDDPYAEWYLLKTYQSLVSAREKLKDFESQLSSHLSNLRGLDIGTCVSTHPVTQSLTFGTPFGFMCAHLIADADYVIRLILLSERIGISLKQETNISIKQIIELIQDVFIVPCDWRKTQVTREDIRLNNERAIRAKEQLGEVPDSILEKQIEFAFLPKKRKEKSS